MQIKLSSALTGDPTDKSVLVKMSQREFTFLQTLVAYTTGGGSLDMFTTKMYSSMLKGAAANYVSGTVIGNKIPLNPDVAAIFEEMQHANY